MCNANAMVCNHLRGITDDCKQRMHGIASHYDGMPYESVALEFTGVRAGQKASKFRVVLVSWKIKKGSKSMCLFEMSIAAFQKWCNSER